MPNFWPEAGATGSVIVTSRNFGLATAPASAGEELGTFNSAESLSFAKNILWDWESESTVERESLSQLLHRLDGLPLAINQITTQINNEGSSIEDFLALYDQYADDLHSFQGDDHKAFYSHSIETVWDLAIKKRLENSDSGSRVLLGAISLLSPDSIPEKLFQPPKSMVLPRSTSFLHSILRQVNNFFTCYPGACCSCEYSI